MTNADLMIETHLGVVTQHTHSNVTDGVEAITQEIMEYCAMDFDAATDDDFLDLEGEELFDGYLKTLDNVIKRYIDRHEQLRDDYKNVVENFAQNPKIENIANVFLLRDLQIMNHVIIELEALRDTFLAKKAAGYEIDTIEEYINNEVEDTMKLIDERVQIIAEEVNEKLIEIDNQ